MLEPINKKDCEVCKQLMKEKHRYNWLWKMGCLICAVAAIVFACLYFGTV